MSAQVKDLPSNWMDNPEWMAEDDPRRFGVDFASEAGARFAVTMSPKIKSAFRMADDEFSTMQQPSIHQRLVEQMRITAPGVEDAAATVADLSSAANTFADTLNRMFMGRWEADPLQAKVKPKTPAQQLAEIEAIHAEFEESVTKRLDLLRETMPEGMDESTFLMDAEYWRMKYPNNNFVTERQVSRICHKYNLVAGPALLFSGKVPEKNQAEIDAFRLRQDDRRYAAPLFWTWVRNNVESFRSDEHTVAVSATVRNMARLSVGGILPIGPGVILIFNGRNFDCFLRMQVHGSEWLLNYGQVEREDVSMSSESDNASRLWANFRTTYTVRLSTLALRNMDNLPLHSICSTIVAPGTMFERHKESYAVRDGYRLSIKDRIDPSPGFDWGMFPNDPICLQPVPGGYLVVSKWGQEALIQEIANATEN